MRILLWHVHGSWTTAFVQGGQDYLLPVTPDRGPDGVGRARTWNWPRNVVEVSPERLRDEEVDVIVLQRPHELELAERWLGRRPGVDVPAVYVEHNTPGGDVPRTVHPLAGQETIPVVHVTHFNALFWDCGTAPTTVVEHGICDPGHLYVGDVPRVGVAINDPVRRGRAVGTDLLQDLVARVPVDVFGMRVDRLPADGERLRAFESLPQDELHKRLARRRVYVHTSRWTSLGLSLLEAMHLGMPVVALATTEVVRAVPTDAGVVTTSVTELVEAAGAFLADPSLSERTGAAARRFAVERYGLRRFLDDWELLLARTVS